jgi:signal transduction histidine kinase
VVHDGRLFGVLYGANREVTRFGDRAVRELERIAARMATAQVVAERARYAAEVAVHEERRRLAIDLHDGVGAMLFTLGANVRRLGGEIDLDPDIRTRLAAIEQQVAEASAALRGSLRALHAPPDQVALPVALREHCRAFADRTGIPARMITLTDLPGLADSRVRALGDTVREALLNVEKHARATSVVVTVFVARGGVAVTVADDGVGLHPDRPVRGASPDRGGLGLDTIAERLARIGGTLNLTPADNAGATLQAWIPV